MIKNSLWRVRMLLGKTTRVSNFSTLGNRLIKTMVRDNIYPVKYNVIVVNSQREYHVKI